MPTVSAIIDYGTIPASSLVDETSLLVQSCTYASTREKAEYKGANRAVQGLELFNPILTITVSAFVSAYSGIPTYNAGQEVTSLANFPSAVLGHDPADGTMVMNDPVLTKSNTEVDKIDFSVMQYPFVT